MAKEKRAVIIVHAQPNARQNQVVRFAGDMWYVKVVAPPEKGKANGELLRFLSDILGVNKSALIIKQGQTNRRKLVSIQGLSDEEITGKLGRQVR